MIYRRKVMPEVAFNDLVESYREAFRALKEPSGAALFVSRNTSPDRTVFLSQDYSEAFERLSPGSWESVYDADLSTCDFAAGDIRMTALIGNPKQPGNYPTVISNQRPSKTAQS